MFGERLRGIGVEELMRAIVSFGNSDWPDGAAGSFCLERYVQVARATRPMERTAMPTIMKTLGRTGLGLETVGCGAVGWG
jgi:hypothetical protein